MSFYILRLPVLAKKIGLSRSTIYDWLNPKSPRHDPTMPRPIRIGSRSRSIGFVESEVDAWLEQRAAQPRIVKRGA